MTEAFLCAGVRTPIGRYAGALSAVRPDDLAAHVIGTLVERSGVPAEAIDEVYCGCVNQAGEDNRNIARMASLIAGLPPTVPGVTVNRLCGSGLEAIGQAARAVRLGEADLVHDDAGHAARLLGQHPHDADACRVRQRLGQ